MEFITESLRLGSPGPTPCSGRVRTLLSAMSSWILDVSKDGDSTVCLRNWFQCLTTSKKLNLPRCGELWHLVMMPTFPSWLSTYTMKQNPNIFFLTSLRSIQIFQSSKPRISHWEIRVISPCYTLLWEWHHFSVSLLLMGEGWSFWLLKSGHLQRIIDFCD